MPVWDWPPSAGPAVSGSKAGHFNPAEAFEAVSGSTAGHFDPTEVAETISGSAAGHFDPTEVAEAISGSAAWHFDPDRAGKLQNEPVFRTPACEDAAGSAQGDFENAERFCSMSPGPS